MAYKGLWEIERAFRTLKTPLEIRPIYHWTESRVRAHVMVCVLSYLLEKVIDHYLKAEGISLTAREALRELRKVKVAEVRLGRHKYLLRTELTELESEILKAMKVQLPPQIESIVTN